MTTRVLYASLDVPLPREVAVGAGTSLFVAGTCYCPTGRLASLELVVDGECQPLGGYAMPRLDFFASLHPRLDPRQTARLRVDPDSIRDPQMHSYLSGFWGIARLRTRAGSHSHELRLRAQLDEGSHVQTDLAVVEEAEPEKPATVPAWPQGAQQPRVAICMATYNPPIDLFRRQIASIREQSHQNWICLVSDDGSSSAAFAALEREIGSDGRFLVSRAQRRLGFFANFERALSMVPPDAELVAIADQDDYWYPDKLETLIGSLGPAHLVYSDARVVGRDGTVISDTYWSTRRNNHSDLLSLLVANSVTGAASLMRREVLDYALPFPPSQFAHFHDHWIALTALSLGEIAFVDRPLYDYVQHGEASLGHATANRMTGLLDRLRHQRPARERVRMWRLHYFVDFCRLVQVATILQQRCGDRMTARKRRLLESFARADRSPVTMARLAARGVRELVGRPETLGAEWMLLHACVWRGLLAASARERPQRALRLDAVPPPTLALRPSPTAPVGAALELANKIAPLELAVAEDAPVRINLLIPTVDLKHFFGGYIAKLNLAKRLAARGLRVRLVTTDPVGPLPPAWEQLIESYSGLGDLFDRVEVAFGRGPSPLEVSAKDGFIATTWWTAHIAAAALRSLQGGRFVYLIQEYEPFTFPMGSYAALAAESYGFEHFALFSTELLRDYFRLHGLGVYKGGVEAGDRESLAFENAITAVQPPTPTLLAARATRKLLFYARPEDHATRNMFELGVLALSWVLGEGLFAGWELHGIGTMQAKRRIPLGGASELELLPRVEQRAYADLLRDHDVGLALMYTPHPSLVPIEMASAGTLAVTNTFENKTAEALAAISLNIIAAEPSVEGVAAGLREAAARVEDCTSRASASAVRWSRDWASSFDDALLARVEEAVAIASAPAR